MRRESSRPPQPGLNLPHACEIKHCLAQFFELFLWEFFDLPAQACRQLAELMLELPRHEPQGQFALPRALPTG